MEKLIIKILGKEVPLSKKLTSGGRIFYSGKIIVKDIDGREIVVYLSHFPEDRTFDLTKSQESEENSDFF